MLLTWLSPDGRHYEADASEGDLRFLKAWLRCPVDLIQPHELDRYNEYIGFERYWTTTQPVPSDNPQATVN